MNQITRYVLVAVSGPLRRSFIYSMPPEMAMPEPGERLLVPFGRSRKIGFFIESVDPPSSMKTKPIVRRLDNNAYLPEELFDLCRWMADYYFANPADCFSCALPSILKGNRSANLVWASCDNIPAELEPYFKPGRKLTPKIQVEIKDITKQPMAALVDQGLVEEQWPVDNPESRRKQIGFSAISSEAWDEHFRKSSFTPERFEGINDRATLTADGWTDYQIQKAKRSGILIPEFSDDTTDVLDFVKPRSDVAGLKLNDEQQSVFGSLSEALTEKFKVHLLHGVTGSGKTLVYCHLTREVLNRNKTILVLTPEIALSGTTLAYFRGFFGDDVTVIHSAMTARERIESWQGIRSGKYKIAIGPRSALFAPLPNLGLIIVDEEHDSSYKQDDPSPRFHGRDCAIMRAQLNDIPVVLGSASPSLESYYHASTGRYQLHQLTKRPAGATLPMVHLVDMKTERLKGDLPYLSLALKKKIDQRLKDDEQAILFLNRRGYSPSVKCAECGHSPQCPNCQIKLTYHKKGNRLTCHYCAHVAGQYNKCEECDSHEVHYVGVGTQRLEENIPRLFKNARPARFDSDTASGRHKAYRILADFADKKTNLLLGTQMVTKGLDLPGVTLVGIVSADASLDMPDFRASEKAFSRLLQVAGRSGRADKPGEVLIQTFEPEHQVIADAARQDYVGFFEREIESRKTFGYPPFARCLNLILSGEDENQVEKASLHFRDSLKQYVESAALAVSILGPAPCPLYFLRKSYRRHILVKTKQSVAFTKMLTKWESEESRFKLPSKVKLIVDVDPDDMM